MSIRRAPSTPSCRGSSSRRDSASAPRPASCWSWRELRCPSAPAGVSPCSWSGPLSLLVRRVAVEGPGRRELAELVTDHVLADVDRNMLLAVVDAESQADELRQDRRAPAPDLDHF